MIDAIQIASHGALNPGVTRTLNDPNVRTLVQAYQKGQEDALDDFRTAIALRIAK